MWEHVVEDLIIHFMSICYLTHFFELSRSSATWYAEAGKAIVDIHGKMFTAELSSADSRLAGGDKALSWLLFGFAFINK